jgi:hypothetical protein
MNAMRGVRIVAGFFGQDSLALFVALDDERT